MSADRELLELAAKAAGIRLYKKDVFTNGLTQHVGADGVLCWNPLVSDGDALRLAVKLGMDVLIGSYDVKAEAIGNGVLGYANEEPTPDRYAATRRAIVRAAADIGRQMT